MAIFDLKDRKLRAVNDKIIVEKATRPKKSGGGLWLPDEDVRTYCEGTVLSVGPDAKSCKAGDHIIWQVFKGQAAGHHDEQRWCLEDKDVMAVLEPAVSELPDGAEVVSDAKPTPNVRGS